MIVTNDQYLELIHARGLATDLIEAISEVDEAWRQREYSQDHQKTFDRLEIAAVRAAECLHWLSDVEMDLKVTR